MALAIPATSNAASPHPPIQDSTSANLNSATDELDLGDTKLSDVNFTTPPPLLQPLAVGPVKTAGKCKYRHGGDNPHVSSGEASSHGWWVIVDNNGCSAKAKVKTRLQAWGCLSGIGCGWTTVKTGPSKSIKPGTSLRANVRVACASTKKVGWRNLVDVDLEWKIDPAGWDELGKVDLNCSPA